MSVHIESAGYRARIDERGAELKSLAAISTGNEYIWHGDPAWWNGSAPVLFPVIGGLKDGVYRYQGTTYQLPSHGFARQSDFRVAEKSDERVVFELTANEETRAVYPFEFRLLVEFVMDYSGLSVRYRVCNEGAGPMYFSIGSHPAFVLDFGAGPLERYFLHFSAPESAERYFFRDGLLLPDSEPVLNNHRQLFLTRSLFDRGPLIFTQFNSDEISIRCSRNPHRVTVMLNDAPCLAVWSKPGGAPFLCIEPWHGLPDPVESTGDLTIKPGIMTLAAGKDFHTGYSVQID